MRHRRALVATALLLAGAIALGLAAAACRTEKATARAEDVQSQIARLQKTTGLLQRQIELANSKDFYLVLDPAAGDITLMLMGAELQRYRVLGLQVGQPRVSWITRPDPRAWQDIVWAQGELDPPRQIDRFVMQAAPPTKEGTEATPPIPPTPEEMYPVPSRYHVRFDDGLSIEIRPLDTDTEAGRWAKLRAWFTAKWHDGKDAAFDRDRDAVRLRITLNPADAASLYRSLPPAVRLVILSGDQKTAPAIAPKAPTGVTKPADHKPPTGATTPLEQKPPNT